MALATGWFKRGGLNGGITDADGRMLTHVTGGTGASAITALSVSAPGVAGGFGALTGLTSGVVYNLRVTVTLTGTAETALTNARIRTNGAAIAGGTALVPTISGTSQTVELPRVACGANGTFDVIAVAAATAGSVYTSSICATPVE